MGAESTFLATKENNTLPVNTYYFFVKLTVPVIITSLTNKISVLHLFQIRTTVNFLGTLSKYNEIVVVMQK